jgi:hypothetical protein
MERFLSFITFNKETEKENSIHAEFGQIKALSFVQRVMLVCSEQTEKLTLGAVQEVKSLLRIRQVKIVWKIGRDTYVREYEYHKCCMKSPCGKPNLEILDTSA